VKGRSGLGENEELEAFKTRISVLGTPTTEIAQGEEITILLYPAPAGQSLADGTPAGDPLAAQ